MVYVFQLAQVVSLLASGLLFPTRPVDSLLLFVGGIMCAAAMHVTMMFRHPADSYKGRTVHTYANNETKEE